uniref:Tripartite motif-containing protein 3-like n=1 Tax=Ciona intestinalis TaxID=7719 RepID=H2XU67_CIOIN|nr:tripartite motif-containing protein 3-like [Ciona intestinalis]|eukprot:XP_002126969.1 tripartite motif-containing protein 3-like [Ciona intestinalis]
MDMPEDYYAQVPFETDEVHGEDPYEKVGISSLSSGMPISGYVDYSYEVGRKGNSSGQFGGWIQHFAVSDDGTKLYACDVWNKRIQLISLPDRKSLHSFETNIAGFNFQARGIHILRNGDLCVNCVGYNGTSKVAIFSPEGQTISHFGPGVFGSTSAMAVDEMDRISVVDRRKMRVITCSKTGKMVDSFDPGIKDEILRISADSKGRLIIPDHLQNAVYVFEHNGRPSNAIKPSPGCGYDFKYPAGVACDSHDNILVADVGNHRVSQFTSEGVYRASVLTKRDNGMWRPHDVVATKSGSLLVSEVSGTYIKVFNFNSAGVRYYD